MYVVSAGTFSRIPPLTLGLLRLLVGVGVLAVAFRFRLGFRRSTFRRTVVAGAIVALTLVLQFVGTDLTGAAEGALLTTTTPAFVLLFGATLEREHVTAVAWFGVAVALAGVTVVAFGNATSAGATPAALAGDALLVASAATWALFSSVGRPLVHEVGAFRAILQASAVAIVLLVPFVPLELARSSMPPLDAAGLLAVAYLGIGATAVAWSLWYRGYAAAPPAVSAGAFFAQPIVGATLGALLLHESIDAGFLVGALLIVVGIAALVLPVPRRRVAAG